MKYPFDCISDLVFVETEIQRADIILVPGGSHPQQMEKAAEIYKQGLAPYILPSGHFNPKIPEYSSEWEFLKSIGVSSGVPEERNIRKDNWYLDDKNIKLVMGEVVKIGKYFETYIKQFYEENK